MEKELVKPKKGYDKEPSIRIRRVFKRVMESKGKISVSQAMRDEGYPSTTTHNPQQLTRSKTWQELLQTFLPEEGLIRTHRSLMNAFHLGHQVFPLSIEDEDIVDLLASTECTVVKIQYGEQAKHVYFWAPDNMARDRALDKAYKLTGKYAPTIVKFSDDNKDQTDSDLSDEERRLVKEVRKRTKEQKNKTGTEPA